MFEATMKYARLDLGTIEAVFNKLGGVEGAEAFLRDDLVLKRPELLKRIATAQVAGAKKFVVKDELKSSNVGFTGGNFDSLFLNLVEENVEGAKLAVHQLEKAALDAPILAELGDRAATKLCWLFDLLKKQGKGEKGVLLVNGYANVVYVRDANGTLWAVSADWSSHYGDWGVCAFSVGRPSTWSEGRQILSRDS